MKKAIVLAFVPLICFCFCGCSFLYDYTEPEDRLIITALGIDKDAGAVTVTAEIADITKEEQPSYLISASANNLFGAVTALENASYEKLLFSQCPVIIIGKNADKDTIERLFDFCFNDYYSLSLSVRLCQTKSAAALLNEKTNGKTLKGYEILALLTGKTASSGISNTENFCKIINNLENGGGYRLPVVDLSHGRYTVTGLAFYKNNSLVKETDLNQSRAFCALTGELYNCRITSSGGTVAVKTVKTENKNGVLTLNIYYGGETDKTVLKEVANEIGSNAQEMLLCPEIKEYINTDGIKEVKTVWKK